MGELKLLDCTLRDGGYVIDWKFGHNNIVNIFERLVDANVDIIEIGFLDDRRPYDCDRSIMPDTQSVEKIYGELDRGNAMVVGMIDYGTCSLEHVQRCEDCFLDGIRVIFKKHLRKEALEYCRQLKNLGYKVFVQLVSVTSYTDDEMMDLIRLANDVSPYAVSMVDTYGLMHQNNLMHYFQLLNEHLAEGISIGYHGHNNFQMGYANCIAMLSQKIDREILVDGSLYGMGKSAGNAPLELIAMHMNTNCGKQYHISQMLEAIDSSVTEFYTPSTWGYNMFYYLAASNDCHPSYVSYLMDKRTLSIKAINKILSSMEKDKKLLYDAGYIEDLYFAYQKLECDDTQDRVKLREKLAGKDVLLVAPGNTVVEQLEKIREYMDEKKPVVIAVNFVPENIEVDYLFMSNSKRYVQMATMLSKPTFRVNTIATSNVTKAKGMFDYTVNYGTLLDEKAMFADNPMIMLLKLLDGLQVKSVGLAGFDGYTKGAKPDYVNPSMAYSFSKTKALEINADVADSLNRLEVKTTAVFVTDSLYDKSLS